MGRAGWTATIIGGVVATLVAVIIFMPRSMRGYVKYQAGQAERALKRATTQQQLFERKLEQLVASNKPFLSTRPEVRRAREELAQRAQLLARARADQVKLAAMVQRDRREDSGSAYRLASTINAATKQVARDSAKLFRAVEEALRYQKDATRLAAQAAADAARARRLPSARARREVQAAQQEHPELSQILVGRMRHCEQLNAQVKQTYAQYRLARSAPGADPVACGKLAEALHGRCEALEQAEQLLMTEIADIDHHVDKVLIDLKTTGGLRYHRYKVIRDHSATKTGWEPVSGARYQGHLDHLGMTIYSKPEGMLGSQALTVAAPPGYTYVDRPRYGAWHDPNATAATVGRTSAEAAAPGDASAVDRMKRVWRFNDSYAYMPALFWGKGYRPVSYRDYLKYKVAATMSKPYYGERHQYGTRGSWTRSHYGSSSYLLLLSTRRYRYGSRYGSRRSGSRRYGSRYGRSSYGGYGK